MNEKSDRFIIWDTNYDTEFCRFSESELRGLLLAVHNYENHSKLIDLKDTIEKAK